LTAAKVQSTLGAMDMDENLPLRGTDPLSQLLRQDLDPLSIDELKERILALKAEIARCETKIGAASSHMSAADALFKKG
jgi:uncharacterized small protein (DUF1192 family)